MPSPMDGDFMGMKNGLETHVKKNTYLGAKTHWSLQKRGVNDSVVLQDLPTTSDLRSRLILRVVRILNLLTD